MSGAPILELGGKLHIRIDHSADAVVKVTISSSRPALAARTLQGRTPQDAVRLIPLIFSLCGGAQRIAALYAFDHAQQRMVSPTEHAARRFVVEMERVREHALRLLTDWPNALDLGPDWEAAARVFELQRLVEGSLMGERRTTCRALQRLVDLIRHRVLGDVLETCAEPHHYARDAEQSMLGQLLGEIESRGWSALGAGASTPSLEALDEDSWRTRLNAAPDSFAQRPDLDGRPRETTPYARQRGTTLVEAARRSWGDGLRTRLMALAGELHSALPKLQDYLERADYSTPGVPVQAATHAGAGVGLVEAARGTLLHQVTLAQGCIQSYRVVAPTEWNFHPRGLAARALARLPFHSAVAYAAEARAVICAIDPCVAYDLDLYRHA